MATIHPSAQIEQCKGPALEFVSFPELLLNVADITKRIEFLAGPFIEIVTAPFAFIQVVPSPQILTSDGDTLTTDGETLTW